MKKYTLRDQDQPQALNSTPIQKKQTTKSPFVDNRSKTVAQRRLQETADNSPQVQKAAQLQATADNKTHQLQAADNAQQDAPNKTGLPDNLKSGIETLSGHSMDDVKVHRNSSKPAQLQAEAYAQGSDIHLASGKEKHLPHEAWHVAQQKQGRVQPTTQMKGKVNINDDAGLEKEADVMGAKALQQKTVSDEAAHTEQSSTTATVQRYTTNQQGIRESKNGALLFQDKKDVYASDGMIAQANGIAGSRIILEKLPYKMKNSQGVELTAVWPKLRDNTQAPTKTDDYARRDGVTGLVYEQERLLEILTEQLYKADALTAIIQEEGDALQQEDEYDAEAYDTLEEYIELEHDDKITAKIAELVQADPSKLRKQKAYNQSLKLAASLSPKYIFPSDCGIMANIVSGQTNENQVNSDEDDPTAGDVMHITPNLDEETADQNLWGSHHGAIVMVDGADYVTLENAKQKAGDDVYKASFDTGWYFGMYGSDQGQTFGDAYADSFAPGFTTSKTSKEE